MSNGTRLFCASFLAIFAMVCVFGVLFSIAVLAGSLYVGSADAETAVGMAIFTALLLSVGWLAVHHAKRLAAGLVFPLDSSKQPPTQANPHHRHLPPSGPRP